MNGLFAKILGIDSVEERDWSVYIETMEKNKEAAGGIVTPNTAMRFSAVYACVRVLSETMASLPLILYERLDRGKQRAQDHYLYPILHDRPNELMTSFEFRETVQAHLALWGNAYIQIEYDAQGRVKSLWPLIPGNVFETRREGNRRSYHYQLPNGKMVWLSSNIIWHIRGLGSNGLDGDSVIGYARKSVRAGLSAQEWMVRFYENDARPGIVLEHPAKLSDTAHENLKNSWSEEHEGVEKSWRMQILEEGMKLHEVGIPPEDAQFIETRKFQVREITRWFRMQPHKIGDLEQATFSNIEHQSIEHVVDTIIPWAKRWEQSIDQNLMTQRDREKYYAEFLVDSLLRGDTESRYAAYSQGKMGGWLSTNDIREKENMNPVDGGDIYMVPLNMVPAPSAGESISQNNSYSRSNTDKPDMSDMSRENRALEDRSASMRSKLRNSYLEIYRDIAARILRREKNDIKKQVKKSLLTRDMIEFMMWMEEYYHDHSKLVQRKMGAINSVYGEEVAVEAHDEINEEHEMTPEIEKFIDSYTGGYAARHVGISQERIKRAIARPQTEEIEIEQAIDEELSTWEENRAGSIAEEESTRFNNALAKTVFVIYGVKKLKSVAIGDSCPYCKSLNGKVIEIDKWFLAANEELLPEGVDEPLKTTTNIGHPPYHGGCDCMVIASFEIEEDIEIVPPVSIEEIMEPVTEKLAPIIEPLTEGE